jgi:hypothetical protein
MKPTGKSATMRRGAMGIAICIPFFLPIFVFAQEETSWQIAAEASFYFLRERTYMSPVVSADYNRVHLEVRYNDEDLDTGSVFGGYNFQTGHTVEFNITPILGVVFGNSNGFAPGALLDLTYKKLSFSSEFEYFFSSEEQESNFFYAWSELVYSPKEWIWFGMAGQRTRAFESDLAIQRGPLLGFGFDGFEITGYVMNPGLDDWFGLISIGYSF